jgi:hypothetical protein
MNHLRLLVLLSFASLPLACGKGGAQSTNGAGGHAATSSSATTSSGSGTASSSSGGTGGSGPAPIAGLRAFYTDLTSGPNTGGQNGKGAFVTVYGNGFGATQGTSTVTIGGGAADNYPIWTDTRVTFQLGALAQTGVVVVHVPAKGDSNGVAFTVRAGNIFFVTASGSDANDGSLAHPWQTIPQAKNAIQAGDVAYLGTSSGDTLAQTIEDASSPYKCALGMSANDTSNSGTADAPKALVAYPGAKVTIGVESGLERGILTPSITGTFDYWVIAGLILRGEVEAVDLEGSNTGWRMVGNDISCPNGTGLSGCVTGAPDHFKFYGNVVHDAAGSVQAAQITKYYHGIYFGGSNHLELGWNVVRDGNTCRGIQFHDTGGPNNFDIVVHDNLIHHTVCDGLNFATVDPSQGPIEAYNNIIYAVGRGPDPQDGSSDYACIYVANITNQGPAGAGSVKIYNNTLYDCGSRGTSAAGAIARATGGVGIEMVNNLIVALSGESYFSGDTDASQITGSNNLFFGAGAPPAGLTASVTTDPKLASATTFDFHLTMGSSAIDQGIPTSAATDFDGNPRPQGKAFDVGAYEFTP